MKRALLVIDVQMEYFTGRLPISHPAGSLQKITGAMDAAQKAGLPVIVVQHGAASGSPTFQPEAPGYRLHPEVEGRPRDLLLPKTMPGSFTNTNLQQWLRENGVDTVTICGYMTQMCCDTTARQAFHRGFQVEFLSDATGTLDIENNAGQVSAEELHRAILVTQAMRFSNVMSLEEWETLL